MKKLFLVTLALISGTYAYADSDCSLSVNGQTFKTQSRLSVNSNSGSPVIMEAEGYKLKIIGMSGMDDSGKSIWVSILDSNNEELAGHLTVAVGGARFASSQLFVKASNGDRINSLCAISDTY